MNRLLLCSAIALVFELPSSSAWATSSALGVNDAGEVVGLYTDGLDIHGFVGSGTSFTTIDAPSSFPPFTPRTVLTGINDSGQFVGNQLTGSGPRGFIDTSGSFTNIVDPLAYFGTTTTSGINDAGAVVGYYTNEAGLNYSGFLYTSGTFTPVNDPVGYQTQALGINNSGEIVGSTTLPEPHEDVGFLDDGGVFTTISVPMSSDFGGTVATDINNEGVIVGYYGSRGGIQGFEYENGSYITIADPVAPGSTYVSGINDAGEIVGTYFAHGDEFSFVDVGGVFTTLYPPTGIPEPTDWALMVIGAGGLGAALRSRRRQVAATA